MNLAEPRSAAVAPACREGRVLGAQSGDAKPSFCLTCEDDGATLILNHGWQHLQAFAACGPTEERRSKFQLCHGPPVQQPALRRRPN